METFLIRVNGGPEQQLTAKTGIYRNAVAAVPALVDVSEEPWPLWVEIWCPRLLPDYGPYIYEVGEDEYGNLVVRHVPRPLARAIA